MLFRCTLWINNQNWSVCVYLCFYKVTRFSFFCNWDKCKWLMNVYYLMVCLLLLQRFVHIRMQPHSSTAAPVLQEVRVHWRTLTSPSLLPPSLVYHDPLICWTTSPRMTCWRRLPNWLDRMLPSGLSWCSSVRLQPELQCPESRAQKRSPQPALCVDKHHTAQSKHCRLVTRCS